VLFVPLNVAAGLSANILSGFFLYGEWPTSPVGFCFGASLLIGGVLCLAAAGVGGTVAVPPAPVLQRSESAAERDAPVAASTSSTPRRSSLPSAEAGGELLAAEGEGAETPREQGESPSWSLGWVTQRLSKRKPTLAAEKPKII